MNRINVKIHVSKSAELGPAAYDIAGFIEILREQTGGGNSASYEIDVEVTVSGPDKTADQPPVVGFTAESNEEYEEEDAECLH